MNWSALAFFDTIPLTHLQDKASLLTRKEIKYIVPSAKVESVLEDCLNEYNLLKIDEKVVFSYKTNYFDTADFKFYFDHHYGKGNRFKIRERVYVQSNLKYVEIKTKTNKNQTIKYRKEIEDWFEANDFIHHHTHLLESDLQQSLQSEYTRITLLHKEKKEKVTLDFYMSFVSKQKVIQFNNIVIAEVKAEKISGVRFSEIMKNHKIRAISISKYCLGLVSLNPKLKHNNFKRIHRQIINTNNNG